VSLAWLRMIRGTFSSKRVGESGSSWSPHWLCSVAPAALRRPLFYEVAIMSGYAWGSACLLFATLAVLRREQAGRWLTAASLSAGWRSFAGESAARDAGDPATVVAWILCAIAGVCNGACGPFGGGGGITDGWLSGGPALVQPCRFGVCLNSATAINSVQIPPDFNPPGVFLAQSKDLLPDSSDTAGIFRISRRGLRFTTGWVLGF